MRACVRVCVQELMDMDVPNLSFNSYINVDGIYWRSLKCVEAEEEEGEEEEEEMMEEVYALGYDDLDELEEANALLQVPMAMVCLLLWR